MQTTPALPRGLARLLTTSRPARLTAGGVVLAVVAAGSLVWASPASAAVPAFPDNIVTFPDRDFVSIEGYEADAGKTMTVTVTRTGQVVGKAQGTIAAGGVALEVNHPGGVCWGTGPGAPNVTPDIQAGDVVTIAVDGTPVGDSISLDAAVGATAAGPAVEIDADDPTILRIRGHVGPGVNTAQLEQRIIAPDLRDTVIARRDVRAVPGARTTDPRGSYDSALEFTTAGTGSDFVATYWFPTEAIAASAAAGGVRIMSWQVEDADANRQGLTISEFGEPGGPGFGGCPNGPSLSGPPAPVVQSLVDTSSGTGPHNYVFTWTPAVAVPGTPAITGYRVRAVVVPADANGDQAEFGKRVGNPAATGTTLSLDGLPNGFHYEFEISSVNALGNETIPPVSVPLTVPDTTGPTVATNPSALLGPFFGSVDVALASESGADLYYAVTPEGDTVPELYNGGLTAAALPYTGPIQLTASSTVSVIGFDALGNVGAQTDTLYQVTAAAPAPDAVTGLGATGGETQATVTWSKVPDPATGPAVSGYTLAWDGPTTGSTNVLPSEVGPGDVFTKNVTGLWAGTYTFTVTAKNAVGSSPDATTTAAVTETLAVPTVTPDRSSPRSATVSLTASTTNPGVTYTWTRVTSKTNGATLSPSLLSSTTGASVQATVPALTLPTGNLLLTDYNARNAPLFFRVTVSKPGTTPVSATVQVTITPDTTTITSARYRAGNEFRISGTESNPAATVRIYRKVQSVQATTFTYVGTATVTAGTFDLRLRPPGFTLVPGEALYAVSTLGGSGGPFTATIG